MSRLAGIEKFLSQTQSLLDIPQNFTWFLPRRWIKEKLRRRQSGKGLLTRGVDKIINCVIITYAHSKCSKNNEKYREIRAG